MDDAPHAPVFPALLQYARLTPLCASSRTHHCTPKTVPPNPNPDLAGVLHPPSSTPPSPQSLPRAPATSIRTAVAPGTQPCPQLPLPRPFSNSGHTPATLRPPAPLTPNPSP